MPQDKRVPPPRPGRRAYRATPGLENLRALAQAVAAGDPPVVYRALHVLAAAATPTSSIFVALYDPERRERICVYAAGDGDEHDVATLPPMPLSDSPQSRAVTTRRAILTDDFQAAVASGSVVNIGLERDARLPRSSLALPMILDGQVVGVIEFQSYDLAAYTPGDVTLLQVAATLAAVATTRAHPVERPARLAVEAVARLGEVIARRAFTVLFQPVVALDDRRIVACEALTRFSDGTAPAARFAEARALGLRTELEEATLRAALEAARGLPAGIALHLNVSPELMLAGEPLGKLLRSTRRRLILEVTEDVVIEDYAAMRRAMARLGSRARLSVDDAGAGFASFRHVVELRPAFVKLDRALVGGIDGDAIRQALVVALADFARAAGCELVAEGIERTSELDTVRQLGVGLGQGYYLGRPMPPDELARLARAPAPRVPPSRSRPRQSPSLSSTRTAR